MPHVLPCEMFVCKNRHGLQNWLKPFKAVATNICPVMFWLVLFLFSFFYIFFFVYLVYEFHFKYSIIWSTDENIFTATTLNTHRISNCMKLQQPRRKSWWQNACTVYTLSTCSRWQTALQSNVVNSTHQFDTCASGRFTIVMWCC